jgi:hypothetical protein
MPKPVISHGATKHTMAMPVAYAASSTKGVKDYRLTLNLAESEAGVTEFRFPASAEKKRSVRIGLK